MFQQAIALVIILFFLFRLFWQKRKGEIGRGEFLFWFVFWSLAAVIILSLKYIDILVARLGFSGRGIEILFYLGMVLLFYIVFKLRLRLAKIEREITKIIRNMTLKDKL
jgi:small membrane protein